MKKILLPVLLLVLIIVFCVWATWRVDQLCSFSAELLEQAGTRCMLGDYDGAMDLVFQSKRNWDCHEGFFGLALRHTESDDIGILYPSLLETCRQQDANEFFKQNLELIATLKHLSRIEIPYYFNIL